MANKGDLNIEIGAELSKVENALRKLQGDFKRTSKDIDTTSRQTSSSMEGAFTGAFRSIASAMAAAFSVQAITQFGVEAIELAAKAEGIEHAFKRIGGGEIFDDLRRATKGTVSDLQLMQSAVQANNFQIPVKQLASLFEFARRRAKETGESVDYLVNSIVLGIGRKSPLILDNLGISAVRLRQELKGVGVEAASVGDIAKIIGNIAQEEMIKMGAEIETTKDKIDQMKASWQNLKAEFGEELIVGSSNLYDFFSSLGDVFELIPITKENIQALESALMRSLTATERAEIATNGFNEAQRKLIKTQATVESQHEQFIKNLKELTKGYSDTSKVGDKQTLTLEQQAEALKKATIEADKAQKAFERLRAEQMFGTGPIVGPNVDKLIIPADVAEDADNFILLNEEIENLNSSMNTFRESLAKAKEEQNLFFQNGQQLAGFFQGAMMNAFSNIIQGADSFGDAIAGIISQLISQIVGAIAAAAALQIILAAIPGFGQIAGGGSLFSSVGGAAGGSLSGLGSLSGIIEIVGKISGEDILLSGKKAQNRLDRYA